MSFVALYLNSTQSEARLHFWSVLGVRLENGASLGQLFLPKIGLRGTSVPQGTIRPLLLDWLQRAERHRDWLLAKGRRVSRSAA